jgi:hypothetical protein
LLVVLKRLVALLVVVAAVFVPVALGASSPVAGNYQTTLAGTPVALLNATWKVEIASSGAFTILRKGKVVVKGSTLTVSPQIEFADKSGSAACLGKESPGYYDFSFTKHGGHRYLVLRVLSDHCSGRLAVLTTHPLFKVT